MSISLTRRSVLAFSAAAMMAMSACGGGSDDATSGTSEVPADGALATVTEGKLTIATGEPAFSPWVENDAPESGEGFEAAVAYAVAEQLGFAKEDVVWKRTTFDAAIAPGAKDWDFNLQQYSITEERKKAVDFSSPYYVTAQAVLTTEDSPAASATSIEELKAVQFGVQSGTSSQRIVADIVAPDKDAMIYNNSVDVVQALKNKQIQAIVVDLPTALYLQAVELDNGVVVGQFEDTQGGDEFALVLPKGSELTGPVTEAMDALREAGTLDELETQWLSESVDVPVLK